MDFDTWMDVACHYAFTSCVSSLHMEMSHTRTCRFNL